MAKPTVKKVSFLVERGIRINGESIYPSEDAKKPVIISLPETFARELQHASKGKIVNKKATKEVVEQSDDDDLEAAFNKPGDNAE